MATSSSSTLLSYFTELEISYSDGCTRQWPSNDSVVWNTNARGDTTHFVKLSADHEKVLHWRKVIGGAIAADISVPDPQRHLLKELPEGYALFVKVTGSVYLPKRSDNCLFGCPTGRVFRSPNEFRVHALWLYNGGHGVCKCGCRGKGSHKRRIAAVREVSTLTRDSIVSSQVSPASDFIVAFNKKHRSRMAASPQTFGPGEIVWVMLPAPIRRGEDSPLAAVIDTWPGIVASYGTDNCRIQLLPGTVVETFSTIAVLPWSSIPYSCDIVEAYLRSFSSPSPSITRSYNPTSSSCGWNEGIMALSLACNAAEMIVRHMGHFVMDSEEIHGSLGLYLGAERIIPGQLVRLQIRREDLSPSTCVRPPVGPGQVLNDAHAKTRQYQAELGTDNHVLLLLSETVSIVQSSETYALVGLLYELVDEDWEGEIDLPGIEPPIGYRFRRISEEGYSVAVSQNYISGRYYSRIMENPNFTGETLEDRVRLAALEGLVKPDSDTEETRKQYDYRRRSRAEVVSLAVQQE